MLKGGTMCHHARSKRKLPNPRKKRRKDAACPRQMAIKLGKKFGNSEVRQAQLERMGKRKNFKSI